MALFQPFFIFFKPDFDHEMLAYRDMFDKFSLTPLVCNMGAWHFFSLFFWFSSQTLTMTLIRLLCKDYSTQKLFVNRLFY